MTGTTPETLPSARILLVDDNKLGLIARKSVLGELGHRITTASEGQEALDRFSRDKFDLVITDYKMPRMNGLELIVRIRERAPTVPIILVSGYVDGLGLTEANTGADVVIPKSAHEVPQLVRSVNRLLRRNAPKKPARAQRPPAKAKRQGAAG
jgi:CheY-like chemotaxis protein